MAPPQEFENYPQKNYAYNSFTTASSSCHPQTQSSDADSLPTARKSYIQKEEFLVKKQENGIITAAGADEYTIRFAV